MTRYRIQRLPAIVPEYDAHVRPYGLWDKREKRYVDKYGRPDPLNEYYCLDKAVAVMRRRDLNEYSRADDARTESR